MNPQEKELFTFLNSPNSVLRIETLKIIRSLFAASTTTHDDSAEKLASAEDSALLKRISRIATDSRNPRQETCLALDCLINASSNSDRICEFLLQAKDSAVCELLRNSVLHQQPNDKKSGTRENDHEFLERCAMLLSNLTRNVRNCEEICINSKFDEFFHELCKKVGKTDSYVDYYVFVVRNFTQIRRVRELLLVSDKEKDVGQVEKLGQIDKVCHQKLCLTYFLPLASNLNVSGKRREAAVDVIRNCCFDYENHDKLIQLGDDLVYALLYPLAGPEELSDSENDALPLDLQYLTPDKAREPEVTVRIKILESLYQLCSTKTGREFLRNRGTYYILREYHKSEKDDTLDDLLFSLINVLIRTEQEMGCENLHDIDLSTHDL